MPCRHYIVEGRVQGVFFRASTREQAQSMGIQGWVRNLVDGRVEVLACADTDQLSLFETWLNEGPEMAIVKGLSVTESTQQAEVSGFEVR